MYVTIDRRGEVHYPCATEGCDYHHTKGLFHGVHISDPKLHLIEDFPGVVVIRFPECPGCHTRLCAQVEGFSAEQLAEAHPHHGTFGKHPAHARHQEVARQMKAIGRQPKPSHAYEQNTTG